MHRGHHFEPPRQVCKNFFQAICGSALTSSRRNAIFGVKPTGDHWPAGRATLTSACCIFASGLRQVPAKKTTVAVKAFLSLKTALTVYRPVCGWPVPLSSPSFCTLTAAYHRHGRRTMPVILFAARKIRRGFKGKGVRVCVCARKAEGCYRVTLSALSPAASVCLFHEEALCIWIIIFRMSEAYVSSKARFSLSLCLWEAWFKSLWPISALFDSIYNV